MKMMYYSVITQTKSEREIPSAPNNQESNLRPSDY